MLRPALGRVDAARTPRVARMGPRSPRPQAARDHASVEQRPARPGVLRASGRELTRRRADAGRRHTAGLVRQVTDLEAREKEQAKRADELQARLTRDEEELKALKDELKQERDLRQRYERVLSEGRK